MRFRELHLVRYGHFEDHIVTFPQSLPDLQIVRGANEAGKSTTMAAVSDLLFGFPHKTLYDYRYPMQLLRVGAVLETAAGDLVVRRKKGRQNTLLDFDDTPIDEGSLFALLAGQEREAFERMFSLDHERLRAGGRAILEAEDDAGRVIFEAGSGLAGITSLAKALGEEAEKIWTPTARTRLYNVADGRYEEARQAFRSHQLKSNRWEDLRKRLETAEEALASARARRTELQGELRAVERCRRIQSALAVRAQLMNDIAGIGDLPELPTDAAATLAETLEKIRAAETALRLAEDQRKQAEAEDSGLVIDAAILEQGDAIAGLQTRKGGIDLARKDTPDLRSRIGASLTKVAQNLRDIGRPEMDPVEAAHHMPGRPVLIELRQLLEERTGLDKALEAAANELAGHAQNRSRIADELTSSPAPVDPAPLRATLQAVRAGGDLDRRQAEAARKIERAHADLARAFAQLSPWTGDAEALARLVMPAETETVTLVQAMGDAETVLAEARRVKNGLVETRARTDLERDQLLSRDHAVSAHQVNAARQLRDETWQELARHIRGEQKSSDPASAADALTDQIAGADALTDQRFDSAKQSAELSIVERGLAQLELQIVQMDAHIAEAELRKANATAAWAAALAPLGVALSPDAYREWRARRTRVLELAGTVAEAAEEEASITALAGDARKSLLALELPIAGDPVAVPLAVLVATAELADTRIAEDAAKRSALAAQLKTLDGAVSTANRRHTEATAVLENWRARLESALLPTGLAATMSPAVIRHYIEGVEQIHAAMKDIAGWQQRIADMSTLLAEFDTDVSGVALACGLDVGETDELVRRLGEALDQTRELAVRRTELRRQIADAAKRERDSSCELEACGARLAPLLAAAGVDTAEALGPLITKVDALREKRKELEKLTREIVEQGDGLSLEALIAEAVDKNDASLAGRAADLTDDLAQAGDEAERLSAEVSDARRELEAAGSSADAISAASDMAMARSEMEVQAEAYLRKRIEQKLLQWTIDRYRNTKQAPLLKRAGEIFSSLTLDRYEGLTVYEEGGGQRLGAIENGGRGIVPSSRLSDGATDQLYLSLRLAAIEEAVARGLKLPVLADDLFINFDDERALAGFKALAKLAEKTQVLFFTHHDHLVPIAARALAPADLSSLRIEDGTSLASVL